MSKYDKDREALGLKPIGTGASTIQGQSKYAKEREAIRRGLTIADLQPPTSISPTGEMTIRPDIEQRLKTESPSLLDTWDMIQRTMPLKPVEQAGTKPTEQPRQTDYKPSIADIPVLPVNKVPMSLNQLKQGLSDAFSVVNTALLQPLNSLLQAPQTIGVRGQQAYNEARGEGKSFLPSLGKAVEGYGKGLADVLTSRNTEDNRRFLEYALGKTATDKLRALSPTAYDIGTEALNYLDVSDIAGIGLIGDAAKLSRLQDINKAADLRIGALRKLPKADVVKTAKADDILQITGDYVPDAVKVRTQYKPFTFDEPGRFSLKNQRLETATQRLESAITDIQNYFKTNELRTDELARIKPELGIDLDKLISDAAAQEGKTSRQILNEIAERSRLKIVSGAADKKVYDLLDKIKKQPDKLRIPARELRFKPTPVTPELISGPLDLRKAPKYSEFTIKIDDGPAKVVDAAKITDGQGKTLYEAMTPDHKELYDNIVKDLEGAQVKPDTEIQQIAQGIKDKSGFSYNMKDVYRNFKQAFGKHYDNVKRKILDPFDNAKRAYIDTQKKYTDDLYENVVKKLGIGKGTKESAAVQWFGEGVKPTKVTDPQTGMKVWEQVEYTLDDLRREFPNKWQDIVEADKWFRQKYNELIEQVNATRKLIYPNNPDKLVPYRSDYYRHFREMSDSFGGVKNLFETPSAIDPSLAGISEWTKPRSRWASFMQKRGLGKYKADAVGGFLDYIKASSYATHIDPQISAFRGLAKDIAEGTAKTRNANNFIKYLQDFANDLAGKTNPADRWLQDNIRGGRATFRVINWINSRVKANTVLGNLSSSLSQIANIPQGIAYVKNPIHLTKGAGNFMASIFDAGHAKLYKQSQFLSERFSHRLFSRFDTKILQQPKRFATWMLGALDEVGTKFIWSSTYNKAIAEGIQNPIKYADDVTRRMVAGRGVGEMPLLQKSKLFQLVAPFQVEVGNLWHVMKDFVTEKDFGGLAILFVANYLLNKGMEELRGSGVTFDPIGAIEDALKEEGTTPLQKAGRLGGEILSNIPLGQTVATILPEDMRKQFFGREDPTRYGTSLLAIKGLQDPLYKLALPFGGSQLKKTIEAQRALNKGGVYGKTKEGEEYLKYPVEQITGSKIKGALFGTGAFPETREYYSSNQRPLGVNQTIVVQQTGLDLKELHKGTLLKRKFETARDKGETLKPIKEEIMNYYNETGDILVFMEDSPQRTFTFDIPGTDEKRKVELTQEQYTEYVRKVLQYARQQVNYSKSFDSYRIASTEKKYEFLRKAVSKAETKAKKELLNQLK